MIDSVRSEAFTLVVTVATGAIVGMFFDLYRVTRSVLGLGRLATAVCDLAFWLFAAAVVFAFLLATSWGEVRFFVFVGFAAGFAWYRAALGRRVVGGVVSVYDLARRARRRVGLGVREGALRWRRMAAAVRRKSGRVRRNARGTFERARALWFAKKGSGR